MRHTEPEAFFSIRSRFQSAGPLVAEPLATSKAPSCAGASAVMHIRGPGDRLSVVLAADEDDPAVDEAGGRAAVRQSGQGADLGVEGRGRPVFGLVDALE